MRYLQNVPLGELDFRSDSDLVFNQINMDVSTEIANFVVNLDPLSQEGFLHGTNYIGIFKDSL